MEKGTSSARCRSSRASRTISAEAVDDAELIEINSMTFDKMIKGNIEIAIRMLRKLSIRLRETERRFEGLQADGRAAVPIAPGGARSPSACRAAGTGTRLEVDGDGTDFAGAGERNAHRALRSRDRSRCPMST